MIRTGAKHTEYGILKPLKHRPGPVSRRSQRRHPASRGRKSTVRPGGRRAPFRKPAGKTVSLSKF